MKNYYKVLQVEQDATPEQIEAAYQRLSRRYSPDVDRSNEAKARLRNVTEAHSVLSDRARRAQFDATLRTRPQDVESGDDETTTTTAVSSNRNRTALALGAAVLIVAALVGGIALRVILTDEEGDPATAVVETPVSASTPPPVNAEPTETDSGLVIVDVTVGTGPAVAAGDTVTVHYTGWLQASGVEFDSSRGGDPVPFQLSGLIPGWQEGIPGMQVGGVRRLIVPPELGYGDAEQQNIPAGSTLIFDIEMIGIGEPTPAPATGAPTAPPTAAP
jgi:peptidylprolyl isomerase